jgi:hypothetical protein
MKWLIRSLRKARWHTSDRNRADKSPFQWRKAEGGWELSFLGVINGVLPLFGIVLIVGNDADYMQIRKRRW